MTCLVAGRRSLRCSRSLVTLVISPTVCTEHDTGADHPEHADRLRAIHQALLDWQPPADTLLVRRWAREAGREELGRVHVSAYLDQLESVLQMADRDGHSKTWSHTGGELLSSGSRQAIAQVNDQ